ncbi:hypothetical protein ACB092_07G115500 [Castanea dentata]
MAHQMLCLSFLVTLLVVIQGIHADFAVEYVANNTAWNTPGGVRFNNQIESEYSKQTLISATYFIWSLFHENTDADRMFLPKVILFIDDIDGVAYAINNQIHVSARYINGYSGDVRTEITGVVPGGLIEGIADYVRLKAGFAPSHWMKPGQGDRWDHGYDVTALFLDYCNSLRYGFVAELNKKLRTGYSSVDQLWSDYKSKYAK